MQMLLARWNYVCVCWGLGSCIKYINIGTIYLMGTSQLSLLQACCSSLPEAEVCQTWPISRACSLSISFWLSLACSRKTLCWRRRRKTYRLASLNHHEYIASTHFDLLAGQHIHFVIDDGMQTQFLEQLDGVFGIVVIAPAEENQPALLGQIHLEPPSIMSFM